MPVIDILIEPLQDRSTYDYARSAKAKLAVTNLLIDPNIHIDCDLQSSLSGIWIQYKPICTNSGKTTHLNAPLAHIADPVAMDWSAHDTFVDEHFHQEYDDGFGNNPLNLLRSKSPESIGLDRDCSMSGEGTVDPAKCNNLSDNFVVAASYPTPGSSPSSSPKCVKKAIQKKARKSVKKKSKPKRDILLASTLTVSLPHEAEMERLELLRSLVEEPVNDVQLREIYQIGDRIISDTGIILNDLKGWFWKHFPDYGILPPSRHHLSLADSAASMFRFLIETNESIQRKSVYCRLARAMLFIFIQRHVAQLERREQTKDYVARNSHNLTTLTHKYILNGASDLALKGKKCGATQLSDHKSSGKRWWKLGSVVGIIAILTVRDGAEYFDNRNSFSDTSLELLINYMKLAYPKAIAHFQSLDPIGALLAHGPLTANHIVDWDYNIDPLHLQFNVPEKVKRVDIKAAMGAATERFLGAM